MSRSQYKTSMEYTESKCVVTFVVKQANMVGHAMLALEGKGIAPNGEDLLIFDFMQKEKAVQLVEEEEKNQKLIVDALVKLTKDLLASELSRRMATQALSGLATRTSVYQTTVAALIEVLRESKDVANYVQSALITSSGTVANSFLSLLAQDVGVIRSSHPLESKNAIQKIRVWEGIVTESDYYYSLYVSREEVTRLVTNIRSEEPKSRPFRFLGQQAFWGRGANS